MTPFQCDPNRLWLARIYFAEIAPDVGKGFYDIRPGFVSELSEALQNGYLSTDKEDGELI